MNTDNPYERFSASDLILRDELAIDRTILANERTVLAYVRSGIALLIAGASIMHFALQGWFMAIGILCLPFGVITILFGLLRYRKMHNSISIVRKSLNKNNPKPTTANSTPSP